LQQHCVNQCLAQHSIYATVHVRERQEMMRVKNKACGVFEKQTAAQRPCKPALKANTIFSLMFT